MPSWNSYNVIEQRNSPEWFQGGGRLITTLRIDKWPDPIVWQKLLSETLVWLVETHGATVAWAGDIISPFNIRKLTEEEIQSGDDGDSMIYAAYSREGGFVCNSPDLSQGVKNLTENDFRRVYPGIVE